MPRLLLVGIASAFVLAGCLDAQTGGATEADPKRLGTQAGPLPIPISPGWSEAALPFGGEHSHADHSHHFNLSTPNFEVIGFNPLVTDYHGRTSGGHFCGDAKENQGRRLSVVHSFTTDVAFVVTDVTDPANPQKIGELAMATTHVYDLAITQDFRYVLLATSPLDTGPDAETLPTGTRTVGTFHDECSGEDRSVLGPEAGLPFASGLVLVDIQNPRNPNVVDFRSFPYLGAHSVTTGMVGTRPVIVSSVANLPGQLSYYVFMEILETPAGGKLNVLSVFQDLPMSPQGQVEMALVTNHDATIHKHPITGDTLAYLAYGNWGLVIVNLNDPTDPQYVSRIVPWDHVPKADANAGYIHEALPANEAWDGRHYTFVGDECGGHPTGTPTCLAYAIDTTDPARPQIAGAWTLPHDVSWSAGLQFSLHYLGLVNQTLFATVYHGGLWAIDVSGLTPGVPTSLPSIGVFLPPFVSPKPPPSVPFSPDVDDLNTFPDGVMVVYDAYNGLYTVRFRDDSPAPSPDPWPLR